MSFLCFWNKRRNNTSPSSRSSLSTSSSSSSLSHLSSVSIIGSESLDIDHFMQMEKIVEDECRHRKMNEERLKLNEILKRKTKDEIKILKKY